MGKPGEVPAQSPVREPKPAAVEASRPEPAPDPEPEQDEELAQAAAPLVSDEEPAQPTPAIDISFEQLQNIWPGLFGGLRDVLGARRWAFFREAVPAGVEGSVIVLEVAQDFHLTALLQDDAVASIVATKASDLFGSPVKVRFQAKQGGAQPVEDSARVDLDDLEERPAAGTDPASLLAAELGAELVDE